MKVETKVDLPKNAKLIDAKSLIYGGLNPNIGCSIYKVGNEFWVVVTGWSLVQSDKSYETKQVVAAVNKDLEVMLEARNEFADSLGWVKPWKAIERAFLPIDSRVATSDLSTLAR